MKQTTIAQIGDRTWTRAVRRLSGTWTTWVGTALTLPVVFAALFAPGLSPYSPDQRDKSLTAPSGPTRSHWLGVDADQKDVLTRVLHGARLSLLAASFSIALAMTIGVPVGMIAGYAGGLVDGAFMRLIDITLSFPSVLIALIIATTFRPGAVAIVLAVGCVNAPMFARQIRTTVLVVKQFAYVEASRSLGASHFHILTRTMIPATLSPILVLGVLGIGTAILEVAGLSFIGIGGDPTVPEWGSMLTQAKGHITQSVWPALGPGIAISWTIMGFNLLGIAVRDAFELEGRENG